VKPVRNQPAQVLSSLLLASLATSQIGSQVFADSINFDPPEANALTPMTVTVDGFIGTNGPVNVNISGGGISRNCPASSRPCSFDVGMGNFSGQHWVRASALVNGQSVIISNFFTVRYPKAFINRACGTNGTKVLVTGHDFGRNDTVYVGNVPTQADERGRIAKIFTINGSPGPYQLKCSDGFRHTTNWFDIGPSNSCEEDIGHVTDAGEGATIQRPGEPPQPLKPGDPIRLGDEVTTGAGGRLNMTFLDDTQITMGENNRLTVNTQVYDPANPQNDQSSFSLLEGAFSYLGGLMQKRPENNVNINTSYGNIGIRGTEFVSRRDPCSTTQEVYLIHGQLAIKPTYASVTNIVDAPAAIYYDATNVWTNVLTQAVYEAVKAQVNPTNPVTFASWQVQHFGCTNDNPSAAATADPDGDGQNNYSEFLARTDPTTNASVFKLLSAVREGNGVRLYWQTHGGITNVVQAAASLAGNYSNLSPNLVIPGDADTTTNYLDAGALTNANTRFYRIRLAP
jgi:hypothetical protein